MSIAVRPYPDPRRHPWRAEVAAAGLEGRVPSARFVGGTPRRVGQGSVGLMAAPAGSAEQSSQLLFGETFTVYDEAGGWAWGQNATDGYVGYLPTAALAATPLPPSHRVTALRSFLYPEPALKRPPLDLVHLTTTLAVAGPPDNGYLPVAGGGWLFAGHLAPLAVVEPDPVVTALRLIGTPYLWGGRGSLGIDCSALVQLALAAAGVAAPRDSDMQRGEVGVSLGPVPADGAGVSFRRGDLVFFPGHVGIMLDGDRLVHATAFVMAVTVEPLAAVIARTDPTRGGGLLAVRRLPDLPAAGA
ncbi:MAG: NlpC/P60 family protein [Rhodospirillaceae bacterium]